MDSNKNIKKYVFVTYYFSHFVFCAKKYRTLSYIKKNEEHCLIFLVRAGGPIKIYIPND